MPHRFPIKVRFGELDSYSHVNHTYYLTYCETARVELLEEAGWGMGRLEETGRRIVVADMKIRFLAAAELGEELLVETTVLEVKRVTTRWRQQVMRDGEAIVEVELTGAITDLDGRPVRVPPGLGEALASWSS